VRSPTAASIRARGAWYQRDQRRLVALPDDADNPVTVRQGQVDEVGTAGL
jgi:hypothetical protein